ncbi:hypothetical protein HYPSUDRAFT_415689 [Hypholoma sublateritium FD-334 SS-4]|uniref:Uncharacterized protein n=1 Tax=Hypholoma sublateritium (strain FD-334 SS-4) TaxID=945553 RepID=A0A0D2N6U7_HYPSF|nr:hypothetical protein HYPSUDRAFT_415689 [Hypholoma sublateritium FD-334 SS-4]
MDVSKEPPASDVSTARRAKKSAKSQSRVDCALAISQSLLNTLQQISNNSLVPGLSTAAGVACTLLQMVSDTRSNVQSYTQIIQEVGILIVCIAKSFSEAPHTLQDDLTRLTGHLKQIQETCERVNRRKLLARFFLSKKDAGDLMGIRELIESNFRVFNLQSTISIRSILESRDDAQMQKLLSAKVDEIVASKQNTSLPLLEPVSWQTFEGNQVFEAQMDTRNYIKPGTNVNLQNPFQSFKGNQVFKGNVTTINRAE